MILVLENLSQLLKVCFVPQYLQVYHSHLYAELNHSIHCF